MLKIRLRRMGARNRAAYRVVVSDSRRTPIAAAVEEIGHYDPVQNPPVIEINRERAEYWVGQGAKMSPTVKSLLKQNGGAAAPVAAPANDAQPEPKKAAAKEEKAEAKEEPKAEAKDEAEVKAEAETKTEEDAPAADEATEESAEDEGAESAASA